MKLFSLRKIRIICPQHRGLGPPSPAHGPMDFIKRRLLISGSMAQIESSESVPLLGCLDPIGRRVAIISSQLIQESIGADPTTEVAGSGRGRRRLTLTAVSHGRARRLVGVQVFSSYDGRFSMRFTPTESQRRGERVYANLNQCKATTKPGNSEAARLVLVHGEHGL
jgi:hypothetical protein